MVVAGPAEAAEPPCRLIRDADLHVSADCIPFALADFHRYFLKDKIVIMFCPKLDTDIDGYISKMTEIIAIHMIN